jgi:hypothetical protein
MIESLDTERRRSRRRRWLERQARIRETTGERQPRTPSASARLERAAERQRAARES